MEVERGVTLKDQGNTLFKQAKFREALEKYSQAIQVDPSNAVYYSNRAMTNIKLERWKDAEKDCSNALSRDAKNAKALWRRAIARRHLGNLKEAKSDLTAAAQLDPKNESIEDELARLEFAEKKVKHAAKDTSNQRSLGASTAVEKQAPISPAAQKSTTTQSRKGIFTPDPKSSTFIDQPSLGSTTKQKNGIAVLIEELDSSSLSPTQPPKKAVPGARKESTQSKAPNPPTSSLQPSLPLRSSEITLASLEKLLRQSSTNTIHKESLYRTLFNLDASTLPKLFGQVGFDTSFLTSFLEAILFLPEHDKKWVAQSVALLDGLRRCGRFGIALIFIPAEKWKSVFAEVERNADAEQRERVDTVKRFWVV